MLDVAKKCRDCGLSIIPTKKDKRPAVSGWKEFQTSLPDDELLTRWFRKDGNNYMAIITGKVSGNLELLDFDLQGKLARDWSALVPEELRQRLVIERSQSGGYHVVYRCQEPIGGNKKLAMVKDGDKILTAIETRGDGGYFLACPSPGYELIRNDFFSIPILTPEERAVLIDAAIALNEYVPPVRRPEAKLKVVAGTDIDRPGDDYNANTDIIKLMEGYGWALTGRGGVYDGTDVLYMTRPGKKAGISASIIGGKVAYIFSTNAYPLEPESSYDALGIYTAYEFGGDFSEAAKQLKKDGFGKQDEWAKFDVDNVDNGDNVDTGYIGDACRQDVDNGVDNSNSPYIDNARAYSIYNTNTNTKQYTSMYTNTLQGNIEENSDMSLPNPPIMADTAALERGGSDKHQIQAALFEEAIMASEGVFNVSEILNELGIRNYADRKRLEAVRKRLLRHGVIAKYGNKRGTYRRVDDEAIDLDWEAAPDDPVDVWLPFGLNDMVQIMPGNLMVVAGESNAGKTAILMNMAAMNADKMKVVYFSSEMIATELKTRIMAMIEHCGYSRETFKKIVFKNKWDNFQDSIKRYDGDLYIVDYLERLEDFHGMGKDLSDIAAALGDKLAMVAIQKNPDKPDGVGGALTVSRSRLYLNVSPNKVSIRKAKNVNCGVALDGYTRTFNINHGSKIICSSDWKAPANKQLPYSDNKPWLS